MQRVPVRSIPAPKSGERDEASPLLRLARRIREEQGTEQARAFLAAMGPFAAPGELKRIAEGFGFDYSAIEAARVSPSGGSKKPNQPAQNGMQMISAFMQLRNAVQGGADPAALIGLLNGK